MVTDERILLQDGVIARERRDLPLNRINDHALSQSLLDRLFGSGTLTVDSIGDQAAVLAAVPHAQELQTHALRADRARTGSATRTDEDDESRSRSCRPSAAGSSGGATTS